MRALITLILLSIAAGLSTTPRKSYWPGAGARGGAPPPSAELPGGVAESAKATYWPPSTKAPAKGISDGSWSPGSIIKQPIAVAAAVAAQPKGPAPTPASSAAKTVKTVFASGTTGAPTPVVSAPKQRLLNAFDAGTDATTSILVCPESLTPLVLTRSLLGLVEDRYLSSPSYGSKYRPLTLPFVGTSSGSSRSDNRCDDSRTSSTAWDLTIKEEQDAKPFWQLNRREAIGSRFFQNPLISAVYERGYRQNFENAGFPGVDKEWEEIRDFFAPAGQDGQEGEGQGQVGKGKGVAIDLSCGSGFMSRKMLQSRQFGSVISVDLSPTMLAETNRRCREEGLQGVTLVRADAARLPFATGSLDYVHAGAALHCWPRIEAACTEIYRVLKPGGKFYASTFCNSLNMMMSQRKDGSGAGGFYLFQDEDEVRRFVSGGGFESVNARREGRGCVIVKATKKL